MSAHQPVTHYENFPVASLLCPANLRAPIAAIYHFARTADDLADEGDVTPTQRLLDLQAFRADLNAALAGVSTSERWSQVFSPLARMVAQWSLPGQHLHALLDAFEQDVRMTASAQRYQSDLQLEDYCTRSANPIGRLLLHLYGVSDPLSLQQSDQICTALQLINFWQDLRRDLERQRIYPSEQAMQRHGVSLPDLSPGSDSAAAQALVHAYVQQAVAMMQRGAPLALRLPGRAGWELRAVIQGGLRITEKIEGLSYRTWQQRPVLRARDWPVIAWRSLRMG